MVKEDYTDNSHYMITQTETPTNKKLVITIAIGEPKWGQMAVNWALSVKAGLPDESGIDVGVIYSESAFEGIEPLLQLFDWNNLVDFLGSPVATSFETKTKLYSLTLLPGMPYNQVLFMDADSMMLPGRSVVKWFEELKGGQFQAYCNDQLYFEPGGKIRRGRKDNDHSFWFDPNEFKEQYPTIECIPQVDCCFMYFERDKLVEKIFDDAHNVYCRAKYDAFLPKPQLYKRVVLAEMCFNAALAWNRMHPTTHYTWRPIFLESFGGPRSFYFVAQEYDAFGIAGEHVPSENLIRHYNGLGEFYRSYFGVKVPFEYNPHPVLSQAEGNSRRPLVAKEVRPMYGFWHVAIMGHWEEVVREQLELLLQSKLYFAAEAIQLVYVGGTAEEIDVLLGIMLPFVKIKVTGRGGLDKFELPTLDKLYAFCQVKQHFGWYIHTKAVSDRRGDHWRHYMNYYNIEKWRSMQAELLAGHDLCGVKLVGSNEAHPAHYSGNFWHYDSNYIKTLAAPSDMDRTRRHEAEFWVCSGNPITATLCQKLIDHFNHESFK